MYLSNKVLVSANKKNAKKEVVILECFLICRPDRQVVIIVTVNHIIWVNSTMFCEEYFWKIVKTTFKIRVPEFQLNIIADYNKDFEHFIKFVEFQAYYSFLFLSRGKLRETLKPSCAILNRDRLLAGISRGKISKQMSRFKYY